MDKIFPVRKKRSIYVSRRIDLDLYNDLFPRICELREKSSEPIYIYLDSRGGDVSLSEKLHELLRAPRFDGSSCTIVTVVPQLAASAAADLAILGDFCAIYPAGIIHCHGTRVSDSGLTLTAENVHDVGTYLRNTNEDHAQKLSQKVSERIAFKIWLYKEELLEFEKKRTAETEEELIPSSKFSTTYFDFLLHGNDPSLQLSREGAKFLERCIKRWKKKSEMIATLSPELGTEAKTDNGKLVTEKLAANAILNAPEGSSPIEIARHILDDATLLVESFPGGIRSWDDLVQTQGTFLLNEEDEKSFNSIEDSKERFDFLIKVSRQEVMNNYLMSTNLCQTFHESENPFTAVDAYLLGLVDEVYGMTHTYPSVRSVLESAGESVSG